MLARCRTNAIFASNASHGKLLYVGDCVEMATNTNAGCQSQKTHAWRAELPTRCSDRATGSTATMHHRLTAHNAIFTTIVNNLHYTSLAFALHNRSASTHKHTKYHHTILTTVYMQRSCVECLVPHLSHIHCMQLKRQCGILIHDMCCTYHARCLACTFAPCWQ